MCIRDRRLGIGERRAIAEEFRHHMQIPDQRDGRRCPSAPFGLQRQPRAEPNPALLRQLRRLSCRRMHAHQMIDRGARRRLAALVQPQARNHGGEIRSPDTRHEGGLGGRRHGAGRRAEHIGHARQQAPCRAARADRADTARMGIDQSRGNRRSLDQAEVCRGLDCQSAAERRPPFHDVGADPAKRVVGQVSQPDLAKIALIPALLMRQIRPFAGHRAHRTGEAAGGLPGEEIGEVHELPGVLEGPGHMFGEPEQLRRFHLRRDDATDITKDGFARRVDPARLLHGTMIHPDDDVALVVTEGTDRQRRAALAQHDQRARCIEADSGNRLRRNTRPAHRLPCACAHRAPDIVARLLDDPAGIAPERDIRLGGAEQRARYIEHTRTRTARADIDAKEMLCCHGSDIRTEINPHGEEARSAVSNHVARTPRPHPSRRPLHRKSDVSDLRL